MTNNIRSHKENEIAEITSYEHWEEVIHDIYGDKNNIPARLKRIEELLYCNLDKKKLDVRRARRRLAMAISSSRDIVTPELLTKVLANEGMKTAYLYEEKLHSIIFSRSGKKFKITTWEAACSGSVETQEYLKSTFQKNPKSFQEFANWFNTKHDADFKLEDLNRDMAFSMIGFN
jgi:hypothetical protein